MAKDIIVNYENKPCYNIHIRDNFDDFNSLLLNDTGKSYNKICIVTDSNVAKIYLDSFISIVDSGFNFVTSFVFEAGEASKNMATVEKLYEKLIIEHFDRGDLLIALGGGVVGDLTGFSAATYMRGIDFVQVPTTLLSQVDSSIGGKTGVDYLKYKNMVGAFYMPRMVYMNNSTLLSLDEDQFACGMGEVIKHGLIADKDYYNWLKANAKSIEARNLEYLEQVVYGSCLVKRKVVEEDPKEKGIRATLNFGHTIGHAIEKLSDFSLFHGQCVSIGACAASLLSMNDNLISKEEYEDILNTFKLFNLPIKNNGSSTPEEILKATKLDKKMVGAKVKFIRLKEVGQADIYMDYSDDELYKAIQSVCD